MRATVVVVVALLLSAVAPGVAHAQWVGLGDSFAAGPLIGNQSLSPLGCLRSDRNFARLAAGSMALTDVSCSGARTTHMTAPQSTSAGTNPPQFNALNAGVRVVSLQIGGNDIGFSEIIENCITYNPFGRPCRDRYTSGGTDQISARIAASEPKVGAVLGSIRQLAPLARVIVVNYAAIVPDSGSGCWPRVPLAYADVPYLRAKHKELNAMLQRQAAAHEARYVDDYTASIGHDACRSASVRWVEPLVPASAAAPLHPNARGMRGIAPLVAEAAAGA